MATASGWQPKPAAPPKPAHRKAFYILDVVLLVCLNIVSVLPVFSYATRHMNR